MGIREVVLDSDIDGDGVVGSIGSVGIGGAVAEVARSDSGSDITLTASGTGGRASRRSAAVLRHSSTAASPGVGVEVWLLTSSPSSLSSVPWSTTPSYVGVVPDINFPSQANSTPRFAGMPTSRIGMRFRAQIQVATSGTWTLYTNSDDGSDLWIDGTRVVNNDGQHAMTSRSGSISLTAGLHDIEVRFFEASGSHGLVVSWQGPGVPSQTVIPASAYSTTATMPPLVAHSTMYLYGDNSAQATLVDAYNSDAGAYGGSNVLVSSGIAALNATSAASWQMNGRASLTGSAVVGPGGTPSSVISLAGSSTITGTRTSATSRTAIFAAQPSIAPATSGNLTLSGSSTQTISSNGRWTSITLSGSSILTLSGTRTIRIDGDLTLNNSARISLAAGSDVTIYLGGQITLNSDAIVNASTADARRLRIYMNGTSRDIQINDRARMSAYVLNPFGRLLIAPQGNTPDSFSGRFAGNGVQTADKTDIHLDVASGGGGTNSTSTEMVSWSAVQPN